jgi:DNA-binding MarR family transcriptional regulator
MPRAHHRPVLTPLPGAATDLGLVDALAQLTFTVQAAIGRVAAIYDLSIVQARLLGILRDRQPTITELAGFLQLDKTSVTGLVDRAQERGLVRRAPSPADGRSVLVSITAAGQELVDEATAAIEAEIRALVEVLSPARRAELSATASVVVAADARLRGIDIFNVRVMQKGRYMTDQAIDPSTPPSGTGCVECEASGGWWFHLRRCAQCGHIGCCDNSPSQHATAHARHSNHPIIASFEPGEDWFYDYRTEDFVSGPHLAPPTHHPVDQPAPGPKGRVPSDWQRHLHP